MNFTEKITQYKIELIAKMDELAPSRAKWQKRNRYYYKDLVRFYKFNIPAGRKILEIGCGDGFLLNALAPSYGLGIDISPKMIECARAQFPQLEFRVQDAEEINAADFTQDFDYIIISDSLGYFFDVQKALTAIRSLCTSHTRIIINYNSFLWLPLLNFAEGLHLKMPSTKNNWLNNADIAGLLALTGFDVIKQGRRLLWPKFFPLLSFIFNKYLANLPFFNLFCFTQYIVARCAPLERVEQSVTIVIPARNEKGNIEEAIKRMPRFGKSLEIIFIEGGSSDGTLDEIKQVTQRYSGQWDIKWAVQEGRGKGDAVRKGFAMATGDVLMILDADLTVPPEDLPKFYEAIASGKGEYINGSRLVYPMEKEAMRILNMLGNKFFSLMFSWLLGQRFKDTLCGTKVISRANWEQLVAGRNYFGDFDPFGDFDLIFGASKLNLKIVELPIRYQARVYGTTNISRFRHGWLLLKMVFFAMNKIKFQ